MSELLIPIIAIVTLGSSIIGTLAGFGISTIMMPVLAFLLPYQEALLLVGIVHFFGDISKMIYFRKGLRWHLLITFGLSGIIASFVGARFAYLLPGQMPTRILGIFLFIYSVYLLTNQSWKLPKKTGTEIVGGAISGFLAGLVGIGGATRSAFLAPFNLTKEVYIFTAGAIGFLVDSTRITTYLAQGQTLSTQLLLGMIIFIPMSFLGGFIAKQFANKIPENRFRQFISAMIFFLSITLII